jgi:hypothetical protein
MNNRVRTSSLLTSPTAEVTARISAWLYLKYRT